jgi:hypothetical protein
MSDYRFDTLEVLNSLLESTRDGRRDPGLWAVVIANEGDVNNGAKIVAVFNVEGIAEEARTLLTPSFKADDASCKDTLEVVRLVNLPLAFGKSLPGLPGALDAPAEARTPTRPVMPPRRFVGRRRS